MTGAGNGAQPNGGLAADGELRALIREVLRDVLPTLRAGDGAATGATPAPGRPAGPAAAGGSARRPPAAPPATPPSSVPPARPAPAAAAGPGGGSQSAPFGDDENVRAVRLRTDEELREFVLQVVRLADNPKRRRDLLAGRLRFTLDGGGPAAAPAVLHRVEKGAVTERAVIAAAGAGAALVLGPRAVLTPLARDKARALGVRVEKER